MLFIYFFGLLICENEKVHDKVFGDYVYSIYSVWCMIHVVIIIISSNVLCVLTSK